MGARSTSTLFLINAQGTIANGQTKQWGFSGVSTFAHMKTVKCLIEPDERYDIAVIGAPFDTAVSYRPGEFLLHSQMKPIYLHIARRTIRSSRNPRRQRPPTPRNELQRPRRHQPVQIMGHNPGLRRYPNHPLRQRLGRTTNVRSVFGVGYPSCKDTRCPKRQGDSSRETEISHSGRRP